MDLSTEWARAKGIECGDERLETLMPVVGIHIVVRTMHAKLSTSRMKFLGWERSMAYGTKIESQSVLNCYSSK